MRLNKLKHNTADLYQTPQCPKRYRTVREFGTWNALITDVFRDYHVYT